MMRLARYLPLGALLILFTVTAAAADVTGTWRTQLPGRKGNQRPFAFHLKQAPDGALTGKVVGFRSENEIIEGKVEGNRIMFSAENTYQARNVVMTFRGEVEGDQMKLTVSFADGAPSLKITATRARSSGR